MVYKEDKDNLEFDYRTIIEKFVEHFVPTRAKIVREVMAVAPEETDVDDTFFLGAVTEPEPAVIEQPDSDDWLVTLPVNGSPVEFKIDTGADITLMCHHTFKRLP